MVFKFKEKDKVKLLGSSYLGLQNSILIIDKSFDLAHQPTYKVYPINEPGKPYIFYECNLKPFRGKILERITDD